MTKNAIAGNKTLAKHWNGRRYSDDSKKPSFSAPSSLAASASGTTITITWTDNTGGVASTVIQRSTDNSTWATLTTKGAGVTSHADTGLADGTYYYRVYASANGNTTSSTSSVNATVSSASSGVQLASGHYVPQKFAMTAVYPRPDAETGTYGGTVNARHRWAYYDGTNAIQYEIPIKVFGGAAPHMYSITSQPSGESATVGNTYGDSSSHGVFKWTPTRAFTTGSPASFTVRVTGQDGSTLDITWTVATDSSTSRFMFVSTTGNDSTGTGAIGSPWRNPSKVMGATVGASTYPGRIVYFRSGSYTMSAHSDSTNAGNGSETQKCRVELGKTTKPMAYLSYPGESVSIDFSNSEIMAGRWNGSDTADDFYFAGSSSSKLTITGSATNAAETHNIWVLGGDRVTIPWVEFSGFIPRTAGNFTNSAPIFASSSTPSRNYMAFHGTGEVSRTQSASNDGITYVVFGVNYFVDDYGYGSRPINSGPGAGLKEKVSYSSTRYGDYSANSNSIGSPVDFAYAVMSQNGGGYNEVLFTKVKGRLFLNYQAGATTGDQHSYRNTIYCTDSNLTEGLFGWAAAGVTFTSNGDVVVSNGPRHISNGTVSGSATFTVSNSEVQANTGAGDMPINTTTLALQNSTTSWRTTYYGTRGAEIA